MNYELLKSFRLWDTLDAAISRKCFSGNRRTSLYPSEASVVGIDPTSGKAKILGGCSRKSWYRLMGFKESDPVGVKTRWIFEFGNYIEDMIRDYCKVAGVYDNNSVKFWDPVSMASGEIDVVVKIPQMEDNYIFIECKSTSGYYKEAEIMGTRSKAGKPMDAHVLQLGTYLWVHKDDPKLIGGKLAYMLRDNMSRREFDMHIIEEGDKHRFCIDGVVEKRYFCEDMAARYLYLVNLMKESMQIVKSGVAPKDMIPPPRDFCLAIEPDVIEEGFKDGTIAKTKYEAWKKNPTKYPISEYQCSYCNFRGLCYSEQQQVLDATRPKKRVSQPAKAA